MKKILLLTNKELDEPGGRQEKISTRECILKEYGWEIVVQQVDPNIFSIPSAVYRSYKRARRDDIDIINTINNPPHLHIVGLFLNLIIDKPWLVEYRDPFTNNPDLDEEAFNTKLRGFLERIILYSADQVIWGDGMQLEQDYFERFNWIDMNKITKLPFLGFEKELFNDAPSREYEEFTITYAGSFYKDLIEPYSLLEGVSKYVEKYQRDIQIKFYGDWEARYEQKVEKEGLDDIVETHEFVPHEEILPVLKGSDICVHIGGTDPQNRLSIPSKIWDYMGSGTPILGIVDPEFRVANFLENNKLGTAVHPDNPEEIAESIQKMRTNQFNHINYNIIAEKFTREKKIKRIVEILNNMVSS